LAYPTGCVVCLSVCDVGVSWLMPKWIELFFSCEGHHRTQLLCWGPYPLTERMPHMGSGAVMYRDSCVHFGAI